MAVKYTTISDKNRRVTLQTATTTQSASGQPTKTWATLATVWSYIRTISGNEKVKADQVIGVLSLEVTINYSSEVAGVKVNDRIKYGSRYFDIKDVRNIDEKNVEIRMLCTEAV